MKNDAALTILNNSLLVAIAGDVAYTATDLAKHRDLSADVVENTLKRLKVKSLISFNKQLKRWEVTKEGKLAALKLVGEGFLSSPSAPTGEAVVESVQDKSGGDAEKNQETNMNDESNESNVADIDAAIAKAKAGKKSESKETKAPKAKLTDEEKAAKKQEQEAQRAKAKAEREALRAAKKAEKDAARKSPHMSKVDKAAAKLPVLSQESTDLFTEVTTNFSRDQIAALALHLQHFNRTKATEQALGQKVKAGDTVKVIGGDPKYIGLTGTVAKSQRIRCYVTIAGFKKDVYLFTSEVEVSEASGQAAANG